MFAISFDMVIAKLKEHYGASYPNAYYEISKTLRKYDFYNTQGSLYLSQTTDMLNLYKAMDALKSLDWFRKSVRDIRAFRVEDWSDFTTLFKDE